jgi:hypothetical protein
MGACADQRGLGFETLENIEQHGPTPLIGKSCVQIR